MEHVFPFVLQYTFFTLKKKQQERKAKNVYTYYYYTSTVSIPYFEVYRIKSTLFFLFSHYPGLEDREREY